MTEDHVMFCSGKPHGMERFLEVCLLMLLDNGVGYGYGLIEQLAEFGFAEEDLNVSTLYRTLRKMEGMAVVDSRWEEGGPGPRRRVYEITDKGKAVLSQWIDILRQRKARISKLVDRYDARFGLTTD